MKGIVAFAFGMPATIQPNRRIAKIAAEKAHELNAPIYTQLDIRVPLESGVQVEYIEGEKLGSPPSTLRIARGAIEWAKRNQITDLFIVAAKPHLRRVLRDIEKAARENKVRIKVHPSEEIEQYPADSWFSPDSIQKRTRSRKVWIIRECILNLMPFFLYKRIASC